MKLAVTLLMVILGLLGPGCKDGASGPRGIALVPSNHYAVVYAPSNEPGKYNTTDSVEFRPVNPEGTIVTGFGKPIDSLRELSASFMNIAVSDSGFIAVPVGNQYFDVYRYDEILGLQTETRVRFPDQCVISSTSFVGNVLFAAGYRRNARESMWLIDIQGGDSTAQAVQLPADLSNERTNKSIDDLLLTGDRLIAVDDVMYPKFLIAYDVSTPASPELLGYHQIPNHGVYESIFHAAVGDRWMATLSGTSGRMAYAQHVGFFDAASLEEQFAMSNEHRSSRWANYPKQAEDTIGNWSSIAFWNDVLLIASGSDGVGVFNPDSYLSQSKPKPKPHELVKYFRPEWEKGMEALQILVRPGFPRIAVVVAVDGRLETILVAPSKLELGD